MNKTINTKKVLAVRPTKTIYLDGDRVIKLFNEGYSVANVLNEALNQARVEEAGLRIPKLLEVTKFDGKWAIVTEYIKGKTLAELMEGNPDKHDEYMDRFVDLQLDMHRYTAPLLNNIADKMHRKIRESGLDATARYELHTRLDGIRRHTKLCHGDYNPSNIIITENNEAYILDWSHATQGNAAADAARTYMLFWLAGDTQSAEKYVRLFCEKSNTARQYVEKWMSIVAASQLGKGNPQEREFLLRWADVVEYE